MTVNGMCPHCQTKIRVEECPGNFVFLVNGKAVTDCPDCSHVLVYDEVIHAGDEEHPLSPFGVTE